MHRALARRVMRAHHPAREARHGRTEDHAPERRGLHRGETQLRQQERGPAVRAPRGLEVLDGDVLDGFDAAFAEGEARVVEEDGGMAHGVHDGGVEVSRAGVGGEVGLEGRGADAFGLEGGDEGGGRVGGAVVVDGDGAAEGGQGEGGGVPDSAGGAGYECEVRGEVCDEDAWG